MEEKIKVASQAKMLEAVNKYFETKAVKRKYPEQIKTMALMAIAMSNDSEEVKKLNKAFSEFMINLVSKL